MRKKVKELIDIIEADGWFLARRKGSHKQYKHTSKKELSLFLIMVKMMN